MNKLDENTFVLISFKLLYSEGDWLTLGPIQRINKNDFNKLLDIFSEFLDHKEEKYKNREIQKRRWSCSTMSGT